MCYPLEVLYLPVVDAQSTKSDVVEMMLVSFGGCVRTSCSDIFCWRIEGSITLIGRRHQEDTTLPTDHNINTTSYILGILGYKSLGFNLNFFLNTIVIVYT